MKPHYVGIAVFAVILFVLEHNARAADDDPDLQGNWAVVSWTYGGEAFKDQIGAKVVFDKDRITFKVRDREEQGLFRLAPGEKPKHIDFMEPGGKDPLFGICKREGDVLTICYDKRAKGTRPTEFVSKDNSEVVLVVLGREKKK